MKKTLVFMFALMVSGCLTNNLKAQADDSDTPMNSIMASQRQTISNKRLAPQPMIQEANVMWKKTIIRQIDFRQKLNQVFYFPQKPTEDWKNLVTVLYEGIQNGDITPYKVKDDDLDNMTDPLTVEEFEKEGKKTGESIWNDSLKDYVSEVTVFKDRMPNVTRLKVKEDWYFDKNLSQLLVRIIAIAPVIVEESNGELSESQPCWIPYDEQTRSVLAKAFVFNRNNGASRLTYDEIFQKRIFDSYIIKEENVYDRYISEYADGVDVLLESDRIKQSIMDFEQSLWQY